MPHLTRTLLAALAGACAALAALWVLTLYSPSIVVDMDVDLPRSITAGLYPVERTPEETFVWTTPLATLHLRGLDRRTEWVCTARLRGGRPAPLPRAQVTMGVDGATLATHTAGDVYEDVAVTVPRRPGGASASVTISTTPAYVPAADPRELGVMVDEIRCVPAGGWVRPPSGALLAVGIGGAVFGTLFAFAFATTVPLGAGILLTSAALGMLLTTGVAAYMRTYLDWILPAVLWAVGSTAAVAALAMRIRGALPPAARFVLAFSGAVLCLKVLALLHPSKDVVDAIFQAHRLSSVLAGNYYFTQAMPGGVQFPYAIGLYVAAAPWAALIRDHVALLRIVVIVAEAVAAGMLYIAIARVWGDRLTGAAAVVLYHTAPLSYVIIGNANLTFAFGQSIAVMAVAGGTVWLSGRRWVAGAVVLFGVAALAFLSHVGVFPLVGLTLFATGVLYARMGGPELRLPSRAILGASVLAALFAVGSYYGHFPEVYRTLDRVTGTAAQGPAAETRPSAAPLPAGARAVRAGRIAVEAYGLPLLGLTVIGGFLVTRRRRDGLTLALAGWGISCAAFLAFRVLAPVEAPFQRYADEFIHRVYGMTLPAAAILGAYAAAWGWRRGAASRLAAGALAFAAVVIGIDRWMAWFR